MLMRPLSRGFTMIELLIGIVVLAILLGMGAPSFMTWMQNAQIRNAADAVLNGMQLARTEAIRRNKPVQFALSSNSGWNVNIVKPNASDPPNPIRRTRRVGESVGSRDTWRRLRETSTRWVGHRQRRRLADHPPPDFHLRCASPRSWRPSGLSAS
jgi:prepilin-type N-terminal cleavage/methylation domain-containing protein